MLGSEAGNLFVKRDRLKLENILKPNFEREVNDIRCKVQPYQITAVAFVASAKMSNDH